MQGIHNGQNNMPIITTPTTPPVGFVGVYQKADGLYYIDETSAETKVGSSIWLSVSTTITMTSDTMYGVYATPLTGNVTIDTTGAIAGVVCIMRHNDATAPTITGGVLHSGSYIPGLTNMIQVIYDGSQAIYSISNANA